MSHITKAEIADSEKYHNEKTTLLLAYEKLDQAAADNYRNSYGILIGQKTGSVLWLHTDRTGAFKRKC